MAAKKRTFKKPEAFDHDGDGKPGGSLPKDTSHLEGATVKTVADGEPKSSTPKYDAAMAARADGTLRRAVLTERGWVTP